MSAAQNKAKHWYSQAAGVALIALGIAGLSLPAPTTALHCLEATAIRQLTPMVSKSEVGRQLLAIYAAQDSACQRTL